MFNINNTATKISMYIRIEISIISTIYEFYLDLNFELSTLKNLYDVLICNYLYRSHWIKNMYC